VSGAPMRRGDIVQCTVVGAAGYDVEAVVGSPDP